MSPQNGPCCELVGGAEGGQVSRCGRRQEVFCGWPSVLPLPAPGVLRMNGGVEISNSNKGLGLFRATGIYVGAILGSGVLVLPAMAADVAGPASTGPHRPW